MDSFLTKVVIWGSAYLLIYAVALHWNPAEHRWRRIGAAGIVFAAGYGTAVFWRSAGIFDLLGGLFYGLMMVAFIGCFLARDPETGQRRPLFRRGVALLLCIPAVLLVSLPFRIPKVMLLNDTRTSLIVERCPETVLLNAGDRKTVRTSHPCVVVELNGQPTGEIEFDYVGCLDFPDDTIRNSGAVHLSAAALAIQEDACEESDNYYRLAPIRRWW